VTGQFTQLLLVLLTKLVGQFRRARDYWSLSRSVEQIIIIIIYGVTVWPSTVNLLKATTYPEVVVLRVTSSVMCSSFVSKTDSNDQSRDDVSKSYSTADRFSAALWLQRCALRWQAYDMRTRRCMKRTRDTLIRQKREHCESIIRYTSVPLTWICALYKFYNNNNNTWHFGELLSKQWSGSRRWQLEHWRRLSQVMQGSLSEDVPQLLHDIHWQTAPLVDGPLQAGHCTAAPAATKG